MPISPRDLDQTAPIHRRSFALKLKCVIFFFCIPLFIFPKTANCTLLTSLSSKTAAAEKEATIDFTVVLRNQTETVQLLKPRLAPIPSKEGINPHRADEVPPSEELKEIIRKVKELSIPKGGTKKTKSSENDISKTSLQIIRQKGKVIKADEISISPTLEAVLTAYRNGSLSYTHRSFDPNDEQEQVYYHQPYSDIKLQSIFDLTILTSGKDIFLSLGYTPLVRQHKTEKESRSRRIKDLKQIVRAFTIKDKRKAAALSPDEKELERIKAAAKANIRPRKLMVKQLLDFFGIRRRGSEKENYEEMTNAFRIYKQWVDRWERMDKYVKRKKTQRIQLNRFKGKNAGKSIYSSPRYNDLSPSKQIQINPYAHEKIYKAP